MTDDYFNVADLIRVPSLIMIFLYKTEKQVSDVSRELRITYAYTSRSIGELEAEGFISTRIVGRRRMCSLTPAGEKIAWYLTGCRDMLEDRR